LVDEIDKNEVSKIYFTEKLDTVIAEDSEIRDSILEQYSVTKITPLITDRLVELSLTKHVDTVFLQAPEPGVIQTAASQVLGVASSLFWPTLLFVVFSNIFRAVRMGNMNGDLGKGLGMLNGNRNSKLVVTKANITLDSFAGSPEIFRECTEVVTYLKNETIYKQAGAEIPRGILLEGPPGTGKTLLAKAIASEADAGFISVAASEFVELFVGMGASKVRGLFQEARSNKPCIIFIDEIDAVGKQRGANSMTNNDEREQTLNQLLAEMDGFADNDGILILAATNRKDVLDQALLRPGRFDRIITVPLPDTPSRRSILNVHTKNKDLDANIDLDLVAEMTQGFSGAQLKNLINEAAIFAVRNGKTQITQTNIVNALDKLVIGIVKEVDTRGGDILRRVAIHEVGHAFLAHYFHEYFEVKKVSIQSTYNGAGGFTVFNEHKNITEGGLYTKDLLSKRLIVALGGKAAETVFYGEQHVSLGAIQDLKTANGLARRMVGNFGMGEDLKSFYNENLEGYNKYSEDTNKQFDQECLGLINRAFDHAVEILSNNRFILDRFVDVLLKHTNMGASQVKDIIEFDLDNEFLA